MKSAFEASLIACVLALAAGCSSADNSNSDPDLAPASTTTDDGNRSPLSQALAARGGAPTNPCAAVLCLAPSTCEVVDGAAVCVAIEPEPNPCAAVSCLAPSTCEVVDGAAVCVPIEPEPDACAAVRCRAGRHCEVIDERARCVRDEAPNPCAAVLCLAPSTCEVVNGAAICVAIDPPNPCAAVSCLAPSTCEVVDGEAVCVPIDAPNPCAAASCLAPSTCEVVDGEAVCVPIELGPFCGGIAAFECPGSGSCVDDPRDDCDPAGGGADCSGVCECQALALCIEGLVFDDSPDVCSCVPASECRSDG